jgi:hypothetical protein
MITNKMFIARSLLFYPGFIDSDLQELSDEIILPAYFLNNFMQDLDDNEYLYANLINTETKQSYLVALGSSHNYDKNIVFAPQWILDLIGCNDNNDNIVKVQKVENMSDLPLATKIIIKPLDPIAFEVDTRECFEKAFMNLHSIKEGITIPISVKLDHSIYAYIQTVEPASISRINNCEVEVEFINDFMPEETHACNNINNINNSETSHNQPNEIPEVIPLSAEERQKQVRESWIKRFQNIAK